MSDFGLDGLDACADLAMLVFTEAGVSEGFALSDVGKSLRRIGDKKITLLAHVRSTNDIDLILKAERVLLDEELGKFANASEMTASLAAGIEGLDAALGMVADVRDPDAYEKTDRQFSLKKNRIGELPRDQARQFFNSHKARLQNYKTSRSSDGDKSVYEERIKNIAMAKSIYMDMQRVMLAELAKGRKPTDDENDPENER